jgi:hypothetical protein
MSLKWQLSSVRMLSIYPVIRIETVDLVQLDENIVPAFQLRRSLGVLFIAYIKGD